MTSAAANVKQPRKAKNEIDRNRLVEVMSFTNGEVIYENPRTHEEYNWSDFGAILLLPFYELMEMKSRYPKYLRQPWLYILDSEVVEHLGLSDFYKTLIRPEEIDVFFNMDERQIVEFLHNTTKDMRGLIINLTKQRIRNKEFGDYFKIKLIEETINEINGAMDRNSLLKVNLLDEE